MLRNLIYIFLFLISISSKSEYIESLFFNAGNIKIFLVAIKLNLEYGKIYISYIQMYHLNHDRWEMHQ